MIAMLTGKLAYKAPDYIIMDVNGVGYRVQIPFSTYYELPPEGSSLALQIHTNVKEDAIHLYGFRTVIEKQFFQLLITVSGVGPKLARDILSNIHPHELASALQRGDLVRLSAIPGIGKKTAERLVLELKEKIRKLDISLPAAVNSQTGSSSEILDDVASALINLGYKEQLVRKTLAEIGPDGSQSMENVLKQALKCLMK